MKIWLKYILGCILGISLCLVLPSGNEKALDIIQFLCDLALRIGRYALYPLIFFSFIIAVYELRETGMLFRIGVITVLITIVATVLLTLLGILSVLIFNPQRIPIFAEEVTETLSLNLYDTFFQLFPYSGFETLLNNSFILPLCIFAGFLGAACATDKIVAKPTLNLFDSLSRVCYAVFSFFVDIFAISIIALACAWMFQYKELLSTGLFKKIIILFTVDFIIVAFIIYPIILRLILGNVNPYRVLYASIAPVVSAFFSGDSLVSLSISMRHVNESLGVRRRISALTMPIFSVFSKAGTALTITVSFIIILKSYSSLEISLQDIFWISGISILLSFVLGNIPAGGTFIALAVLCSLYGKGFESGYLILKPLAFFICSIATAFDALTNIFGTYIIAQKMNMTTHREVKFFI